IQLGYIGKAHGLRGEVKATFDVQDLLDYQKEETFYIGKKGGPIRPVKVKNFRVQSNSQAVLHLAESDDRDTADALRGHTIYFPIAQLKPLSDGHYYYFQVIGFQVIDVNLGPLGTVQDFADGAANDILIMDYQGKEVLIPVVDHIVGMADFESQSIQTNLPAGLLEAYTE
ncbi:MAG: ribosome maturation factor RimM, partial [Bacteroidota bacterium]